MTNSNYLIDVSDLHKSFGELQVLKGVSEHISKGEVVSIIGPSGGGKSTFLRCLNLLEVPDSGHIFFEGEDITAKGVNIDLHIAVEHGVNIATVCRSIIGEVRYHVERLTGVDVKNVDIYVESIKAD